MKYGVWCVVYDIWCMMYDVCCMMYELCAIRYGYEPSNGEASCDGVLIIHNISYINYHTPFL